MSATGVVPNRRRATRFEDGTVFITDHVHWKVRAMGYFDAPPSERALREFTIHRDPLGHWVASETHGLSEGIFFNFKEAFHFAVREADGDTDRVHVEPARAFSEH